MDRIFVDKEFKKMLKKEAAERETTVLKLTSDIARNRKRRKKDVFEDDEFTIF